MPTAIVTDVTRMHGPNVCVAVTQVSNRQMLRLDSPQPTDPWLTKIGGLRPGTVVKLDWEQGQAVEPPHTEDGVWGQLSKVGSKDEDELTAFLDRDAQDGVIQVFGKPFLIAQNGNAAFRPGRGGSSLATVRVRSAEILLQGVGARVRFTDASNDIWSGVPLNDLAVRAHQSACRRCRLPSAWVNMLRSEFQGGPALLRVGLSRKFRAGDHPEACWLQVNHVFLLPPKREHFV
jgi:hypothetical protein